MRSILASIAALGMALFMGVAQAQTSGSLLGSSSSWSSFETQDNGFKVVGISDTHQLAMELPAGSQHFQVRLSGYSGDLAIGSTMPVTVAFENGAAMRFTADVVAGSSGQGPDLLFDLPDDEVKLWTHDLTALQQVAVAFPSTDQDAWIFSLSGTTPVVTAMAKGIQIAGITGLPYPWNIQDPSIKQAQAQQDTSPPTPNTTEAAPSTQSTSNDNSAPRTTDDSQSSQRDGGDFQSASTSSRDSGGAGIGLLIGMAAIALVGGSIAISGNRSQPGERRGSSTAGLASGIFCCLFSLLGIFTFGLLFLPFGAFFGLISVLRVATSPNGAGGCAAFAGVVLTIIGFVVSPTVWLAIAAMFLGGH